MSIKNKSYSTTTIPVGLDADYRYLVYATTSTVLTSNRTLTDGRGLSCYEQGRFHRVSVENPVARIHAEC